MVSGVAVCIPRSNFMSYHLAWDLVSREWYVSGSNILVASIKLNKILTFSTNWRLNHYLLWFAQYLDFLKEKQSKKHKIVDGI